MWLCGLFFLLLNSIPTYKYSTSYLPILSLIIPIFAIMNKYY